MFVGALRRAVSRGVRRVVWRAVGCEYVFGARGAGLTGEWLEGEVR